MIVHTPNPSSLSSKCLFVHVLYMCESLLGMKARITLEKPDNTMEAK